jgi:pimeloyl-ACP methyl ester carboxylesterase
VTVRVRLAAALVVVLLSGGCTAADPGPDPSPAVPASPAASDSADARGPLDRFYRQTVTWQACRGSFECATIEVPLDYGDPAGTTLSVALLRTPATDDARRIGSLLVNPGGPGVSGVAYAQAADVITSAAVRAGYDVVGFDPRGVGASEPLDCVTDAQLNESFDTGDSTPDTPAEVAELLAGSREYRDGCSERSPDLLAHVGTQDVARDLDVVRAVLGDERLTYLGKSYGTSIGVEYARQFPDRVGRMVLDGAVDPTLSDADVLLGQAAGFELALSRFVADCLQQECPLGSTAAEVLGVVEQVLERTDDSPLPTDTRPLTQVLATYGILFPLYLPPDQGYPVLQAGLLAAREGDGTVLLQVADTYLGRNPDGSFDTNQWDAFTPISCLDRPGTASVADVEEAMPAFLAASPRFGEGLAWGLLGCTDWPVASAGLPGPVRASGAPPILVVGTTGDPATPFEWSQALADQLESGVLLTYDGTPHTAYRKGSSCIDDAVDAYLLEGTVPPGDQVCR